MYAKKINSFFDPARIFSGISSQSRKGGAARYDGEDVASEESDYYNSSNASGNDGSESPLRFIIIRHGERVDVMFGAGWTQRAFDAAGHYHSFDTNMPPSLPYRANWQDYDVDTPLTTTGLSQSWNVGNVLARYNLPVTACYSSPAFRSIQTADRILEGMGRKGKQIFIPLIIIYCHSFFF
jgi:hypothetical protein